jgi:hypothetical protein
VEIVIQFSNSIGRDRNANPETSAPQVLKISNAIALQCRAAVMAAHVAAAVSVGAVVDANSQLYIKEHFQWIKS